MKTTNYKTPKEFYKSLNKKFGFNYNPGSYAPYINWKSCSFVKPNLGEDINKWVIKALNECSKGKLIVMLLPARTDTSYFHKYILRYAREIWFIQGRLKFGSMKKGAPFPSMVVVFRNYPRAHNVAIRIKSVNTKLTGIRTHDKRKRK